MVRFFWGCVFLALCPGISAQVLDTSICKVLAHPSEFDGKIVRLKGTVVSGFDEFVVRGTSCKGPVDGIWLDYPERTKAKAGPTAMLSLQLAANSPAHADPAKRTPVVLDRDKEFKRFDALLSDHPKVPGTCLGCPRYTVTATLTGRLDGVDQPVLGRQGKDFALLRGFGNMNRYPARLVIQSVADVEQTEIDYSKPPAATGPGTSLGLSADEVARAAAAYGTEGEDNGVLIDFGTANTEQKGAEQKAATSSPDALLLHLTLDTDRLKGPAMAEAMAHMGTHIADLRESPDGRSLRELEAHAWAAAILAAIQAKETKLTLPGGYVLWDSKWTDAERDRLLPVAANSFLTDWSGFGH